MFILIASILRRFDLITTREQLLVLAFVILIEFLLLEIDFKKKEE